MDTSELWFLILSGGVGAAIIKLFDGLLQFALQRRAKKSDAGAKHKSETDKRLDAIQDCMMVSMLDRIQYLCKCYIKDGCIDVEDRRRLHIMHQKYHGVGGNGDLDELIAMVDELPLKLD